MLKTISNSKDAAAAVRGIYEGADSEMLSVLLLNNANILLGVKVLSVGSDRSTTFSIFQIAREALLNGARKVILVHNHPGGAEPRPSNADIAQTAKAKRGLDTVEVQLADHIILGGENYSRAFSFAEETVYDI